MCIECISYCTLFRWKLNFATFILKTGWCKVDCLPDETSCEKCAVSSYRLHILLLSDGNWPGFLRGFLWVGFSSDYRHSVFILNVWHSVGGPLEVNAKQQFWYFSSDDRQLLNTAKRIAGSVLIYVTAKRLGGWRGFVGDGLGFSLAWWIHYVWSMMFGIFLAVAASL